MSLDERLRRPNVVIEKEQEASLRNSGSGVSGRASSGMILLDDAKGEGRLQPVEHQSRLWFMPVDDDDHLEGCCSFLHGQCAKGLTQQAGPLVSRDDDAHRGLAATRRRPGVQTPLTFRSWIQPPAPTRYSTCSTTSVCRSVCQLTTSPLTFAPSDADTNWAPGGSWTLTDRGSDCVPGCFCTTRV